MYTQCVYFSTIAYHTSTHSVCTSAPLLTIPPHTVCVLQHHCLPYLHTQCMYFSTIAYHTSTHSACTSAPLLTIPPHTVRVLQHHCLPYLHTQCMYFSTIAYHTSTHSACTSAPLLTIPPHTVHVLQHHCLPYLHTWYVRYTSQRTQQTSRGGTCKRGIMRAAFVPPCATHFDGCAAVCRLVKRHNPRIATLFAVKMRRVR